MSKKRGAILTTLSERLRQQGRQIERQEGRLEGIQDKEWLVVRNSLSRGLPVNKVKEMKSKIEREKLAPIPPPTHGPATGNAEYRV